MLLALNLPRGFRYTKPTASVASFGHKEASDEIDFVLRSKPSTSIKLFLMIRYSSKKTDGPCTTTLSRCQDKKNINWEVETMMFAGEKYPYAGVNFCVSDLYNSTKYQFRSYICLNLFSIQLVSTGLEIEPIVSSNSNIFIIII